MDPADFDWARQYRLAVATFVVLLAALELLWMHHHRRGHDARESGANLLIYVVDAAIRWLSWGARLALFTFAYQLTPLRIATTWWSAFACYMAVDLILYWFHRLLHEHDLGWALHSVHHTSRDYNLTLGVRISWLIRIVDDVVYVPLALLGFSPLLIMPLIVWNRFSQYWIHTEMIGRLPWLDGWLNTPSNHRVHHAAQPGGVRANYGSNFVIWDRLFGTYQAESGALKYGTDQDVGHNPLMIQVAGLRDYARRRFTR